jgi:hypothetical protein
MGHSSIDNNGVSRRGFLLGTGIGALAGGGLVGGGALAWRRWENRGDLRGNNERSFSGRSREVRKPEFAMPGPYPGRVIEVHHPESVSEDNQVQPAAVKTMMDRGMIALTGADDPIEAWKRFFEKGDVVGIKVNPVGYSRRADAVGSISSPAVLLEVVANLKSAGVHPRDIVVFERYANEFREAKYDKVMTERGMDGVRWYASGSGYDPGQLNIEGYDTTAARRDRDPHVVGYDPDVFVHMGFAERGYEDDERRFRSHLSVIITRMVNKFVTIPVLKDHRSAGVTLALKNLSHGLNNNVARSHLGRVYRLGRVSSGPNQCNTFIPTAAGQLPIRQKAMLHILDGLIAVYEGGPGSWNRTWNTWRRRSLFFATDPVAMDHVGWDIIDTKRAEEGWRPVAAMGKLNNQEAEDFDRRQPEHIILSGTIGLGIFDARQIEHQVIHLPEGQTRSIS